MNNQSEVMKKVREVLESAADHYAGLGQRGTKDEVDETLRLLDSAAPEGGQEAVAWAVKDEHGTTVVFMSKRGADAACQRPGWQKPFPLYAAPQPAGLIPVSEVEALAAQMEAHGPYGGRYGAHLRSLIRAHQSAQPSVSPSPQSDADDARRYRRMRDVEFDPMLWDCLRTCSVNAFPTLIDDYAPRATPSDQQDTKPQEKL